MQETTDVIFRIGRHKIDMMNYCDNQAVIAVFPGELGSCDPQTCMAYAHVGQHFAVYPRDVIRTTRPATPKEFAELRRELTQRGYRLRVRYRLSRRH